MSQLFFLSVLVVHLLHLLHLLYCTVLLYSSHNLLCYYYYYYLEWESRSLPIFGLLIFFPSSSPHFFTSQDSSSWRTPPQQPQLWSPWPPRTCVSSASRCWRRTSPARTLGGPSSPTTNSPSSSPGKPSTPQVTPASVAALGTSPGFPFSLAWRSTP